MQEFRTFTTRQIILRQRMAVAAIDVLVRAVAFRLAMDGKANFNPNQPRVPGGRPDGGRWTRDGEVPAARETTPPADWDFRPEASTDDLPVVPANFDPPVPPGDEEPPKRPDRRPRRRRLTTILVEEAEELLRQGFDRVPLVRYLQYAIWPQELVPYIDSYMDAPRSLVELQARANLKLDGYQTHHIVEQGDARSDGYSEDMINGRENLVLVPTIRHYRINGWYSRRNPDHLGLSPRQYLRGRSWEERRQLGVYALKRFGVME